MKDKNEIIGRLNVLIGLEIRKLKTKRDKKTTKELVKLMNDNGLDYKEIASVLGMSAGTVANELTALKRKKKK